MKSATQAGRNLALLAILLALSLPAAAGNDNNPPNECGNHGNNCGNGGGDDGNAAGGNGYGGNGTGIGVGIGVGVGQGGQGGAGGEGGRGGSGGVGLGGDGGSVLGSGNSNNLNSNKAEGGTGIGFGGDANQAQGQQQGQAQTSKNTNVLGQAVDASSANDNRSNAAGNTTSTVVSFKDERNAPPVYLGQLSATMSCSGSFNAGSSSPGGAGAFGFTWISGDCRSVVAADKFRELGMIDTSCKILKTTKGFKRAAKADPTLASIDCAIKPTPAAAIIPPPQASAYAPRIPRG